MEVAAEKMKKLRNLWTAEAAKTINEPWLIDESMREYPPDNSPLQDSDAVCVYVPLDLSKATILRRLDFIIARYGEANEENEMNFSADVEALVAQIEVYDQIWYVRHMPPNGGRSMEAKELVREFIARLESIPDGCAECFPFELIERLREEYL